MKNKIYYFEIPDIKNKIVEEKVKYIFRDNLEFDDVDSLIFVDNDMKKDIFYTFWSTIIVDKIVQELKMLEVVFLYKDITEQVLLGTQFNNVEFCKVFSNGKYKMQLDLFLKSNLSKDNILDKIGKYGVESLNDLDKEILSL